MTPLQQRGFDDAKAGRLDPVLAEADTPDGRTYRDGTRFFRRDVADGLEQEAPGVDGLKDPSLEEIRQVYGAISPIVDTAIKLTRIEAQVREAIEIPVDRLQEPLRIFAPPAGRPRKRKAKPQASDQLSLL